MYKTKAHCLFLLFLGVLTMNTSLSQSTNIDLQGHRGCRGLMPENTVPAMIKAIQLGVTTLEMDVVISKDKKVILSHDHYMNPDYVIPPMSESFSSDKDKSHLLYQMNQSDIIKWDVGSKGNFKFPEQQKLSVRKPLLSELIDSVETYIRLHNLKPVHYNIETKSNPAGDGKLHPSPDEFVDLLVDVIQKGNISKRTTIQSFDKRTLQVIHQKYPNFSTSYLIGTMANNDIAKIINDLGFQPLILSPEYKLVTASFINECKKRGIRVIVWTVNEADDIKKMALMGVDGIISDYPDRFEVLQSH
jgi:glycerophosphoryl diester phosphodiesterase